MVNTQTRTHRQALNIHVFIVDNLAKWLEQNKAECIECNDFVEKYASKNPEIFQAEINKVKEQDELANSCVRSGIIQIVKCRY